MYGFYLMEDIQKGGMNLSIWTEYIKKIEFFKQRILIFEKSISYQNFIPTKNLSNYFHFIDGETKVYSD